jgi:hypothetical protein
MSPLSRALILAGIFSVVALLSTSTGAAQSEFRFDSAWAFSGPCCGDSGDDLAVGADGSYFIVGNYGAWTLIAMAAQKCDQMAGTIP